MVARPPASPISAAPASDRRMSNAATPTAAAAAPTRPPKNPDHVLLGEKRGQSLGPFKALPTTKAQMSAAQVVANSIIVQPPRPACVCRAARSAPGTPARCRARRRPRRRARSVTPRETSAAATRAERDHAPRPATDVAGIGQEARRRATATVMTTATPRRRVRRRHARPLVATAAPPRRRSGPGRPRGTDRTRRRQSAAGARTTPGDDPQRQIVPVEPPSARHADPGAAVSAASRRPGRHRRHLAEATLARLELLDRRAQVLGAVVGPIDVLEDQLGVGALPEQEVGQPPLVAGADDQVGRRRRRRWKAGARRAASSRSAGAGLAARHRLGEAARRVGDVGAAAVVEGDLQVEAVVARRCAPRPPRRWRGCPGSDPCGGRRCAP